MKDSQPCLTLGDAFVKYIKANNERFSTSVSVSERKVLTISRRIMKDSQPRRQLRKEENKYIKANNERFSTQAQWENNQE